MQLEAWSIRASVSASYTQMSIEDVEEHILYCPCVLVGYASLVRPDNLSKLP